MAHSIRQIARGGAAVLAASALTISTAGLAGAEEGEAYPEPTVSTTVEGNNIITTITDNGTGEIDGNPVQCANLGMLAVDALPLASQDPEDIELFEVLGLLKWGALGDDSTTNSDTPEVEISAVDNLLVDDELPSDTYASIGVCLSNYDGLAIESMAYDAPVFVPGGFGSIGQALNLGSSTLSSEGGLSTLLDAGSAMLGG